MMCVSTVNPKKVMTIIKNFYTILSDRKHIEKTVNFINTDKKDDFNHPFCVNAAKYMYHCQRGENHAKNHYFRSITQS